MSVWLRLSRDDRVVGAANQLQQVEYKRRHLFSSVARVVYDVIEKELLN